MRAYRFSMAEQHSTMAYRSDFLCLNYILIKKENNNNNIELCTMPPQITQKPLHTNARTTTKRKKNMVWAMMDPMVLYSLAKGLSLSPVQCHNEPRIIVPVSVRFFFALLCWCLWCFCAFLSMNLTSNKNWKSTMVGFHFFFFAFFFFHRPEKKQPNVTIIFISDPNTPLLCAAIAS